MTSRLLALASFVSLVALAGFVSAAPVPIATPVPTVTPTKVASPTCPAPTNAQCKSAAYLKSACGIARVQDCKAVIQEAFKNDPGRDSSPTQKVLKVGKQNMPKDLHDGHLRSAYGKPRKGRAANVAGKNVIARSGLTKAPALALTANEAATAHRKPKWDTNGEQITSCEEYAYEQLYDGMRYVDSVGACAGDYACEVEIAYLTKTPGIARRTLKRKDGRKIITQLDVRDSGTLAKNDMFAVSSGLAYAIDPVVDGTKQENGSYTWSKTPEQIELAGVLSDGHDWYSFGCTSNCGPRKFKNEWGFHDKLRERNQLSDAEFAEWERRKAEFRKLYDAWQTSAAAGKWKLEAPLRKAKGMKFNVRVSPIDIVSGDPIERMGIMTDQVKTLEVGQTKFGSQKAGVPNTAIPQVQGSWRGKASPAVGVLAAPKPTPTTPKAQPSKPAVKPKRCSPLNWTARGRDPEIDDFFMGGPAACKLADFLKKEYQRKKDGQKSCLDLGDDDCDWSPSMFHGRFVSSFPYGDMLQTYEEECFQWTGGTIEVADLKAAEKYIAKMKELVGEALAKVGQYKSTQVNVEGKSMWQIGRSWVDAESFGDKDWFAAGYDYDVGWHIQPADLSNDSKICDMSGDARGNFGIDAWLLGNDISIVDAKSNLRSNELNSGITHFDAMLKVLGQDMFDPVDANFTTAWAPEPDGGVMIQLPEGWKPSFTFMAGPVPVTGAVWGSLFYATSMSADAKLASTKGTCDPSNVTFMVSGMVQPMLGVSGYAQVGVGISGIVSAGIRGMLNLVTLGLPFNAGLKAKSITVEGNQQAAVSFNATLSLAVSTLSGYIALYVEFFLYTDEWQLFSWSGVSDEVDLITPALQAELPLVGWPQ